MEATIDEVEKTEKAFLQEFISKVLRLSYTYFCNREIWKDVFRHPGHVDLSERKKAYNYFYEGIVHEVKGSRVWGLAQEVAFILGFQIHLSWNQYISELYKLSSTAVCSIYDEIDNFMDDCREEPANANHSRSIQRRPKGSV